MLRARRFASLAFTVAVFASCSQIVGLDSLEPDDDEGTGGTGLSSGATGGDDEGGSDGSGGKGGSSGGTGGSSGGRGGRPSAGGEGGEDSSGGSISDGGTKITAGTGGVSGSGGTTTIPEFDIPEDCAEVIEITSLTIDGGSVTTGEPNYIYLISPGFGAAADDFVDFEIYSSASSASYNGEATGTFEIEGTADASYVTCSRCLKVYEDDLKANFFAMGGTITVASDSDHMEGTPNITLTDVTFVESVILIKPPFTSTPVENPRCLHLASALLNQAPPPPPPPPPVPTEWTCIESYWIDGYCDCGCGAPDMDCETATECEYCYCDDGFVCDSPETGACVPE
jgi:hypothetical protein